MRLLLCDDHSIFAESLALVLNEAGYEVVAVTRSLDETLDALRQQPVDVCVLDVGAAPAAILDRLAELRSVAPTTKVVLLSGYADPELATAAASHDVQGYAYKGQHVADIIDMLERVHGGETVTPGRPHAEPAGTPAPPDPAHQLAAQLTPREREVLCHLVHGEDTHGVARTMGVTWATARSHIQSVLTKLGVHSRVEAAAAAVRHGLVNAETGEWRQP
jgi:DNA-binding NarL/FixJ family response regulator